ncbi:unnamed protein product, partial [Adineta ricciae]
VPSHIGLKVEIEIIRKSGLYRRQILRRSATGVGAIRCIFGNSFFGNDRAHRVLLGPGLNRVGTYSHTNRLQKKVEAEAEISNVNRHLMERILRKFNAACSYASQQKPEPALIKSIEEELSKRQELFNLLSWANSTGLLENRFLKYEFELVKRRKQLGETLPKRRNLGGLIT